MLLVALLKPNWPSMEKLIFNIRGKEKKRDEKIVRRESQNSRRGEKRESSKTKRNEAKAESFVKEPFEREQVKKLTSSQIKILKLSSLKCKKSNKNSIKKNNEQITFALFKCLSAV